MYYRMPLGYGPFPGPRQSVQTNQPHVGWDKIKSTTTNVVFRTSKSLLASFLPHDCFSIDSELPTDRALASLSFTRLEHLPWLAGRGYNHFGFYIHDVKCTGKTETSRGKFLSVLFEDKADPIISGREELGYPKLFANLVDRYEQSSFNLNACWEGTVFGNISLSDLHEVQNAPRNIDTKEAEGILCFKYIPKTGFPGEADVQYPTFTPPPAPNTATIISKMRAEKTEFKFQGFEFEQLPTLHHIAARLAELHAEEPEILQAEIVVVEGASDLSNILAIEI
jgi:hypothetical protein